MVNEMTATISVDLLLSLFINVFCCAIGRLTFAGELSEARRKLDISESQLVQIAGENEGIRQLLHDK